MRLIDADALLKDLQESHDRLRLIYDKLHYDDERQICAGQLTTFVECAMRIHEAPTIEAEPVKHGRCDVCERMLAITQDCPNGYYIEVDREQKEMSVWFGDECLAVFSIEYCPNCGAKMDLEGCNG